jgi:hypothetical protein
VTPGMYHPLALFVASLAAETITAQHTSQYTCVWGLAANFSRAAVIKSSMRIIAIYQSVD